MAALTKGKNLLSHSTPDCVSNIRKSEKDSFLQIQSCCLLEASKDYRWKETLHKVNTSDSVPPVGNRTLYMLLSSSSFFDYIENNNINNTI
jgi:hypothetical protein